MFPVIAYFSRKQKKTVKTIVDIMSSYEAEMMLTMLVTLN